MATGPPRRIRDRLKDFINEFHLSWKAAVIIAILIGCLFIVAYTASLTPKIASTGVGLLIAGFAFASGFLPGFLFGVPRTPNDSAGASSPARLKTKLFGTNTNLEQISDWLTKIIVGVGLVELKFIPPQLSLLAQYLSTAFAPAIQPAVVLAVVGYFSVVGLLGGYLWARIYLMEEFSRMEREVQEKPEFSEGLIHAYLYQPRPLGFENALEEGESYLKRFGPSERVAIYLACGYGQKYGYLKADKNTPAEQLKDARDKALFYVNQALQINPETKTMLSSLWSKEIAQPPEDDLVVFADDEDFKKLLGPSEKAK